MKVNLYNNNHTRCISFLRIENEFMHNSSSLHLDDDQSQTGRKNGRKYGRKERKKTSSIMQMGGALMDTHWDAYFLTVATPKVDFLQRERGREKEH